MKRALILILFLLAAFVLILASSILEKIGSVAWNIINISSTYPPIKEYEYQVSALKLQDIILNIDRTDTVLQCAVTDTTGREDNLKYYMNVKMKIGNINYYYNITYEDKNKFWKKATYVALGLVGVFDSTNNVGGYKKEEDGVENLVDIFDKNFISKIETKLAAIN